MLIFVLQTIWLFIKELAGKDLDVIIIFKFLIYYAPKLFPLVLPLTILLSSIMVFGNFAENYEFAAMKSTGISLQRVMAGLSVFIVLLGIVTFFFANNVIPWGEYNSYNLRKNIAKLKPAMVISEGQFNDIGDMFNIKVGEKSGEKGQFLKNIVIHKKNSSKSGNYVTIIAKNGELIGEESSDILQLILFDGHYYDDTPPRNYNDRKRRPFIKSAFKKHVLNIDLSLLNSNVNLEDKSFSDKYSMLGIRDLNYSIDSLQNKYEKNYEAFSKEAYSRIGIQALNTATKQKKDSIYKGENVLSLFDNATAVRILNNAVSVTEGTANILKAKTEQFKAETKWINQHIFALHEKIALGFACIILFFVGAPLGALIRKGGIGLPMVIAILLFLTYHFIGLFAKNNARSDSINPALAAWISTIIMLPLGVYLTLQATKDRGLFNLSNISTTLKKVFSFKK